MGMAVSLGDYSYVLGCFCENGIVEYGQDPGLYLSSPLTTTKVTLDGGTTISPGFFKTYDSRRQFLIDWGDGTRDFYDTDDMIAIENGTMAMKSHTYSESGTYDIKTYGYISNVAFRPTGGNLYANIFYPSSGIKSFSFNSDTCISTIGSKAFSNASGFNQNVVVTCVASPMDDHNRATLPGAAAYYDTQKMKRISGYPFGVSYPDNIHGIDYSLYDIAYFLSDVPAGTKVGYYNRNGDKSQSLSIFWGDGSATSRGGLGGQTYHTYSKKGDYIVAVRIYDTEKQKKYVCGLPLLVEGGGQSPCPSLRVVGGEFARSNPYLYRVEANGIIDIGDYAFYGCSNMRSVSAFNSALARIGTSAFEGTGLNRVPIINSSSRTLEISNGAFKVAPNRFYLYVGNPFSQVTIGNDVFNVQRPYGAANLDVYFNGKEGAIKSRSGFPFCSISDEGYGQTEGISWVENNPWHFRIWCLVDWGYQPLGYFLTPRKTGGSGASATYEWKDVATDRLPDF